MWSPDEDGWVLVGVPDCNGKSVAKDVQLCVEVGAVHEEGVIERPNSAILKLEDGDSGTVHPVLWLHLHAMQSSIIITTSQIPDTCHPSAQSKPISTQTSLLLCLLSLRLHTVPSCVPVEQKHDMSVLE